jgi:membrane protein
MAALMRGLNRVHAVAETRSIWKTRLICLGATLVAGAMALVAAFAAVIVPAIANWIGGPIGVALDWLRLPLAGFLIILMWALLFWLVPNVQRHFEILTPGSITGVVLWAIVSWGFSQYVTHFGKFEVTYGAVGGVIVLLLWMWASAQVLLLGAEINKVLASPFEREKPTAPERPPQRRSALEALGALARAVLVWRRRVF